MSLRSDTVYWVVCDGCGERPEDGEGYQPVYDTAEIATRYSGLAEVDGQLLCDDCKGTASGQAHGTSEGHGVFCAECSGSGHDPAWADGCPRCSGTGVEPGSVAS